MADIFISYARADREKIERLASSLEAAGFSVWWDDNIQSGADFSQGIQSALDAARIAVVAWSQAAIESRWVKDEAAYACDRGKLIPISLDGTEPPLGFRQLQCADLSGWGGADDAAFRRVLASVAARLGRDDPPAAAAGAHASTPTKPAANRLLTAIGAGAAALIVAFGVWHAMSVERRAAREGAATILDQAATSPTAAASERPAPVEKSVAVLPFVALSSGPDDGYFADGLTEEILNALTTLPDLLVTARTSAFHFKGKDTPIPEIAATLGVAHVVEGSVRRDGDKVRITAQLIRAADGFHLWSQTYDRSLENVFAAQTDIAENIARALGVLLDEHERRMIADAGVRDIEAFLAYQRGHELWTLAHDEGPLLPTLARANIEFEAAIARKPDFAQAHLQHADLYGHFLIDEAPGAASGFVSETGLTVDEATRRLAADLDAAYRFEKDPGQRLAIRVVRTTISSDWSDLKPQIERTFAALKNCRSTLWFSQVASVVGYAEAAHQRFVHRARCDPLAGNWKDAVDSAIHVGRPEEALKLADEAEAQIGEIRSLAATRILANLALGRTAEADALFAAAEFDVSGIGGGLIALNALVPAAAGRAEEWANLRPELERNTQLLLIAAARFGDRATANAAAGEIDQMQHGAMILIRVAARCYCGAPFDLAATPNFARRLKEGGLPWPPASPIAFPLKDW